jgi:hypothetical protein
MCMIDGDDRDYFAIQNSMTRRARKSYECMECGRVIEQRETYERFEGLSNDYGWVTHIMCQHCQAATGWLTTVCGGFLMEGVLIDLDEHWMEHGAPIHSVSLGRLIVGLRNKWTIRGYRIPVEHVAAWAHRGADAVKRAA